MKKSFFFIAIIILVFLGIAAYLGFVPYISPYLVQPQDLGVKADPTLVTSIEQKYAMQNKIPGGVVPRGRQAIFTGSTKLVGTFTSAEITSVLAYWKHRSPTLPIRAVQVRFNPDGTGEISGILEFGTALGIAKQLGYSDAEIAKGESYIKYIAGDIPFYVKGIGNIENNHITLNPSDFELGHLTVPSPLTSLSVAVVIDMIDRRINQLGDINIRSANFADGSFHIDATVPDTVQ